MLGDDNVLEKSKSADILHGKHIRIILVAKNTSDKLPFRRLIYRGLFVIGIKMHEETENANDHAEGHKSKPCIIRRRRSLLTKKQIPSRTLVSKARRPSFLPPHTLPYQAWR